MMRWLIIAAVLPLVGCGQTPPAFPDAGDVGPESLQLVPADYFSKHPRRRPGPRPTENAPAKARPVEGKGEDGTVRVAVPEPEVPPETTERLEQINERLQKFRRSITRPPAPRTEPPT
jgi:hypothetical protein